MQLSREDIENFVREPYLSRGIQYFNQKQIHLEFVGDSETKARSVGTGVYNVLLKRDNDGLYGECSCQAFRSYGPCKHIAATGFALIQHNRQGHYRASNICLERINERKRFEDRLANKTKDELIEMILSWIDNPRNFYEWGNFDEEDDDSYEE